MTDCDCRLNQEAVIRLAEAGFQLTQMYAEDLCLTAGSSDFHSCWPLAEETVKTERDRIDAIPDPVLKAFQQEYLDSILKKRKVYHQAYLSDCVKAKVPQIRQDMKRGMLCIKTSVVSILFWMRCSNTQESC